MKNQADPAPRRKVLGTSYGRLLTGTFANAVGRTWILLLQIFSVPVLVSRWGAHGYGVWLMLIGVPWAIILTDFGFGTAAAADMTRSVALKDYPAALKTFQSIWVILVATCAVVLLGCVGVWLGRHAIWTGPRGPDFETIADAALVMCLYSFLAVQMNILGTVYRSTGRYTEGTLMGEMAYPVEGIATLIVAWTGGGWLTAALAMLGLRAAALTIYYLRIRHLESWLRLGWDQVSGQRIRQLARPALAAFSVNLSLSINLQGTLMALGLFVSPSATALYGVSRTLARAPIQFVGLVSRAVLPELTTAHARADATLQARLIVISLVISLAMATPAALILAVAGPFILHLMSHGRLTASHWVFLAFAAMMLAQAMWNTIAQFLFALNKQEKFAFYYTGLALLAVAAPALGPKDSAVLRTVIVAALCEFVMLVIVYRAWRKEHRLSLEDVRAAAGWFLQQGARLGLARRAG